MIELMTTGNVGHNGRKNRRGEHQLL